MMRRGGSRRRARFGDEDDESVVIYDLDAGSHGRQLLQPLDAVSSPPQRRPTSTTTADRLPGGNKIFARQQQPLFNLDDSGDEGEQEEENPFASLLQQQQQKADTVAAEDEEIVTRGKIHVISSKEDKGQRPVSSLSSNSSTGVHRSILKPSHPHGRRMNQKKLGFESADSRPERWSTRKPSATDTKNRRKSLSAIQQRRSQLEAPSTKRRKSMPLTQTSSQPTRTGYNLDDSMASSSAVPKKRLLSDVLQRATMSQQLNSSHDESAILPAQIEENPVDSDAILDTEHQMRSESFAPQIFSPTKSSSASSTIGRKPKSDATVPRIRGNIGDVIRKAIRKSNRDLTLLRSQGQHLLQNTSHSSSMGTIGALESIQDRPHIVICLKKLRVATPHVAYECYIHEVAAKLKESTANTIKGNRSIVLEALFQPQAAQFLKLSAGIMVKIYEPLHFVADEMAPGSISKPKWFLLCTQLAEVIDH